MRMIRVRVSDETFDAIAARADSMGRSSWSIAALVRDLLDAAVVEWSQPVSDASDTAADAEIEQVLADLPKQNRGVGRPTADQWARLNKWLAATGRQPEAGEVTTRSGLLAWAVGQGFQP